MYFFFFASCEPLSASYIYILLTTVDSFNPEINNRPYYDDIHSSFIYGRETGSYVTWEPLNATDNFGAEQLQYITRK